MTPKINLSILFLILNLFTFGQSESINQFNVKGKKDGKWIVYLDKNWKKTADSSKAIFSRFTYFDDGTNIYPMGICGGKNYTLLPTSSNKKIELLDGEYKWYDGKGRLSSVHLFKNGEYVFCKEHYQSGQLNQHFDYTKKCDGQLHSWIMHIYDKKGSIKFTAPFCKDSNGNWPKTSG
jgi:antitoxin component YwqK of YwqJK toxin-antitoxin module